MPSLKESTMIKNLNIYLPTPKEKKDDRLERKKHFIDNFTKIWNNLEEDQEPSPSSWKESISADHSKKNLTPLFDMITILSPALSIGGYDKLGQLHMCLLEAF